MAQARGDPPRAGDVAAEGRGDYESSLHVQLDDEERSQGASSGVWARAGDRIGLLLGPGSDRPRVPGDAV